MLPRLPSLFARRSSQDFNLGDRRSIQNPTPIARSVGMSGRARFATNTAMVTAAQNAFWFRQGHQSIAIYDLSLIVEDEYPAFSAIPRAGFLPGSLARLAIRSCGFAQPWNSLVCYPLAAVTGIKGPSYAC
jgi:hypothetical protein